MMKIVRKKQFMVLKIMVLVLCSGYLSGCIVAAAAVGASAGTAGALYFDKNYQVVKKIIIRETYLMTRLG